MPVIIAGRAGALWGLNEASGMILQMAETDATIEENPSKNADGEVAMTSFFNPTRTVEYGGVYTGGGGNLGSSMGAAILIPGGGPSGTIFNIGIRSSQLCDGFASIHLRGKQYSLI